MQQRRNYLSAVVCAAAFLGLASIIGCENDGGKRAHTHMGADMGKDVWNEVSDSVSTMWIADPPRIKKIEASTSVADRYRERIYLYPGIIRYENITGPFNTSWGLKESAFQQAKNNKVFSDKYGLKIERSDVKEQNIGSVRYALLSKEGDNGVCFFFFSIFGNDWGLANSLGDTHVEGGACHRSGSVTSSNLEMNWIDLLGRLRFDGPKPGWASLSSARDERIISRQSEPSATPTSPSPQLTLSRGTADERPIAIRWEGFDELLAGTVSVNRDQRGGGMRVTLPRNHGTCRGTYRFGSGKSGTWSIACTNSAAAAGTFTAFGSGKGSSGTGIDSEGRRVEFTMGGR